LPIRESRNHACKWTKGGGIHLNKKGGVHIVALPFTLKKNVLRQKKKNYENSIISPCKNIIFKKKSSKRKPKSFKIS
jgi:hypothetical protein